MAFALVILLAAHLHTHQVESASYDNTRCLQREGSNKRAGCLAHCPSEGLSSRYIMLRPPQDSGWDGCAADASQACPNATCLLSWRTFLGIFSQDTLPIAHAHRGFLVGLCLPFPSTAVCKAGNCCLRQFSSVLWIPASTMESAASTNGFLIEL
jgi:hypothetical protein